MEEQVLKILDLGDNLKSVHDAPIMDQKQNEVIILLAKKIDELNYKLGVLHEWKLQKEGI